MGIYDRDYYRDGRPMFSIRGPRTVVGWLIAINVVIFLVDHFTMVTNGLGQITWSLSDLLEAHSDDWKHPFEWYRFLTYGFAHDPNSLSHIAFNMLTLWFFGREVERLWGWKEFLRFYLAAVVIGSVVWVGLQQLVARSGGSLMGASGAVTAVFVLFAFKFPHRQVYLLFIPIPIPAWILGVFYVGQDALGALFASAAPGAPQVAYSVHLAGAAFAGLYLWLGWNLGSAMSWLPALPWRRRVPALRVHRPEPDNAEQSSEDQLMEQADAILAKISREGLQSLTRKERRLLEAASRRAQERRQTDE